MFGRHQRGLITIGFAVLLAFTGGSPADDGAGSPWSAAGAPAGPARVIRGKSAPETVGGGWFYWTTTPFAFTRFDGGYSPFDGKVYFLGGRLSGSSPDTDGSIWSFDPRTEVWTDTGFSLPIPISTHCAAARQPI